MLYHFLEDFLNFIFQLYYWFKKLLDFYICNFQKIFFIILFLLYPIVLWMQ